MKAIRLNKHVMPLLVVAALLGSVYVAKAAGLWQTSGRGQILLDETGAPDPAGIKGWMTLGDISDTYGLPLADLYAMIGASPDIAPDTALKDLEKLVPGMEVWAVRAEVAAYQSGNWSPAGGRFEAEPDDHESADGTPMPEASPRPLPLPSAVPESEGERIPQGDGLGAGAGGGEGFVLPDDGSRLPGSEIKGRMTLQEVVVHCQVPLEVLVAELALPTDVDTQLRMRDLAAQMGIEVQTVRDAVDSFQTGP
jgi:hypothetical protein